MRSDIKLEFNGFSPDEKTRDFISKVAEAIHFSAPSDAALKLVIAKANNSIQASCKIVSRVGHFMADSVCDSPTRAIQQIEKKIRSQLDNWKKRRFENGSDEIEFSQEGA